MIRYCGKKVRPLTATGQWPEELLPSAADNALVIADFFMVVSPYLCDATECRCKSFALLCAPTLRHNVGVFWMTENSVSVSCRKVAMS
ncbi:MAG: hypothetical protein ACJAYC_001010 [Halieaceae bacterium]